MTRLGGYEAVLPSGRYEDAVRTITEAVKAGDKEDGTKPGTIHEALTKNLEIEWKPSLTILDWLNKNAKGHGITTAGEKGGTRYFSKK